MFRYAASTNTIEDEVNPFKMFFANRP